MTADESATDARVHEEEALGDEPGQLNARPSEGQQEKRIAGELDEHHRAHAISQQVDRGLELDRDSRIASHHRRQEPERGLEAAGGPARLLASVRVDGNGQLLRDDEVFDVGGFPSAQLGPVAEVEVFCQGPRAPAAGVHDRHPPPDSRGAGEVREVAAR